MCINHSLNPLFSPLHSVSLIFDVTLLSLMHPDFQTEDDGAKRSRWDYSLFPSAGP